MAERRWVAATGLHKAENAGLQGCQGGGLGLQHPPLRVVWCGREMREKRTTVVLPEVNVVLSVEQLSSCGCIYFNMCWRRKGGGKKTKRMRETKMDGRQER